MPPFNKSVPKRAANNSSGDRKVGSKSPNHRGYRPADAAGAPKQRWTQSDRDKRAEGGRSDRGDRRPDWTPREKPAYQPRGERPAYGDRQNRSERPAYGDRAQRSERPAYGDRPNRTERPSTGSRTGYRSSGTGYNDRPARTERPSYGDRQSRSE